MKILVTGSSGYLGSVLCKKLEEAGHIVKGFDNGIYGEENKKQDIRNGQAVMDAAKGCDIIIWLAGIVGDAACDYNREYTTATNVEATKVLCHLPDKYLIFASSCSVYGFQKNEVDETSPLNPISYYAETKIASEDIIRNLPNRTVLRFPTMYGYSPRMRYDLVVNKFVLDAVTKKEITVHGGGQKRPFCSVSDVADGIVELANLYNRGGQPIGVYNFGGKNYSLLEVAWLVAGGLAGFAHCKVNVDKTVIDARSYEVNFDNIEAEIGKVAKTSLTFTALEIVESLKDFEDADKYYNSRAIRRNL